MPTRVLLTGAGGFVGSHVLRHLLVNTDWTITCPVTGTHRGQHPRLDLAFADPDRDVELSRRARTDVLYHDLCWPFSDQEKHRLTDERGGVDVIMNVASESHVDRSIEEPVPFVMNNTRLMLNLLELAREVKPKLFLQMSTDEVYGPADGDYRHTEGEPHRPSNPYSASKSMQESLAYSYWRTYGVPVMITNTMNIFGETQDPEKFFAKVMRAIARGEVVTVHGRKIPGGRPTASAVFEDWWVAGSRFYLHARNLADAWLWLAETALDGVIGGRYGDPGVTDVPRYNIVGETEISNDDLVRMIYTAMMSTLRITSGIPPLKIEWQDFHSTRPGHDLRYALDGSKLAALGWVAPVTIREGIQRTVDWTLRRPEWL